MLLAALKTCILRDLAGLGAELDGYPDDASVWAMPQGVSNSTGTLTLHCCGNLRHFVGTMLAKGHYVRDRDAEFALRDLPRSELHALLAVTMDEVGHALDQLDEATLPAEIPLVVGGGHPETVTFLVHLATHLAYHLGQADVHRRIVTGERRPVGAMDVKALLAATPR
jgi:hypothetical protein